MGREFAAGKMKVDLLATESDCLAPVAERHRFHPQNALVEGACLLDAGNSQNNVIDGGYVHHRAGCPHFSASVISGTLDETASAAARESAWRTVVPLRCSRRTRPTCFCCARCAGPRAAARLSRKMGYASSFVALGCGSFL